MGACVNLIIKNKGHWKNSGPLRQICEASDVISRMGQLARMRAIHFLLCVVMVFAPVQSFAAPYAAMVMDARTGEPAWSRCKKAPKEFISLESAALTSDGAALLVCFGERTVEALDPKSGKSMWSVSTGSDTVQVPLSIVALLSR